MFLNQSFRIQKMIIKSKNQPTNSQNPRATPDCGNIPMPPIASCPHVFPIRPLGHWHLLILWRLCQQGVPPFFRQSLCILANCWLTANQRYKLSEFLFRKLPCFTAQNIFNENMTPTNYITGSWLWPILL